MGQIQNIYVYDQGIWDRYKIYKYRNWVYGTDTKHMKFLEDNSQYVFYLFYIHFQYLSFPECAILSRQSQSPITAQSPNCPTQSLNALITRQTALICRPTALLIALVVVASSLPYY